MDIEKHNVHVDPSKLANLSIKPPRRRLWDFLPESVAIWLLRHGFNPKPTPYETWALKNIMLRSFYEWQKATIDRLEALLAEPIPLTERKIPESELN